MERTPSKRNTDKTYERLRQLEREEGIDKRHLLFPEPRPWFPRDLTLESSWRNYLTTEQRLQCERGYQYMLNRFKAFQADDTKTWLVFLKRQKDLLYKKGFWSPKEYHLLVQAQFEEWNEEFHDRLDAWREDIKDILNARTMPCGWDWHQSRAKKQLRKAQIKKYGSGARGNAKLGVSEERRALEEKKLKKELLKKQMKEFPFYYKALLGRRHEFLGLRQLLSYEEEHELAFGTEPLSRTPTPPPLSPYHSAGPSWSPPQSPLFSPRSSPRQRQERNRYQEQQLAQDEPSLNARHFADSLQQELPPVQSRVSIEQITYSRLETTTLQRSHNKPRQSYTPQAYDLAHSRAAAQLRQAEAQRLRQLTTLDQNVALLCQGIRNITITAPTPRRQGEMHEGKSPSPQRQDCMEEEEFPRDPSTRPLTERVQNFADLIHSDHHQPSSARRNLLPLVENDRAARDRHRLEVLKAQGGRHYQDHLQLDKLYRRARRDEARSASKQRKYREKQKFAAFLKKLTPEQQVEARRQRDLDKRKEKRDRKRSSSSSS